MTVTQNKFSSQGLGTCDKPKVEIVQYTQMAKWIADARETKMDEDEDSEEQDKTPAITYGI